jgi:hypothetical protein
LKSSSAIACFVAEQDWRSTASANQSFKWGSEMAASKPNSPRRKQLFIFGGIVVIVLALIALDIPQLIYWEIQGGIADSHARITQSYAETQSVGGSQGPLSREEQDLRVQDLTKAIAAGHIAACNPDLTPLVIGAPQVIVPGTPVSEIRCMALSNMSTRPAPAR